MSGRYNAALVRYQAGHVYVDRSGSDRPREVYLEMGGISDRSVALEIAGSVLDLYREANETTVYAGQVRDADQVPGTTTYQLGDTMGGAMVRGLAISLVGDGLVGIAPETDDPIEVRQAAINRQLQRAASGIRSEYAKPNIVDPDTGSGTDTTPPEFSLSGAISATFSPAWRAVRPWWCAWLDVQLRVPGSTGTRCYVLRSTTVAPGWEIVGEAVVNAGDTRGIGVVNRGWSAGQRLVVTVNDAGAGAADLTATLRGVMV